MPVPSAGCVRGRAARTAARGMAGGGMPVAHLTGVAGARGLICAHLGAADQRLV